MKLLLYGSIALLALLTIGIANEPGSRSLAGLLDAPVNLCALAALVLWAAMGHRPRKGKGHDPNCPVHGQRGGNHLSGP